MYRILMPLLLIIGSIHAQQFELITKAGALRISSCNDMYGCLDNGQLSSAMILGSIAERLDYLEDLYTSGLSESDFLIAELLFNEIRFLLGLIPEDCRAFTQPYILDSGGEIVYPMPGVDFELLISRLRKEPFAEDKLNVLWTVAGTHYLIIEQVERIIEVFAFDEDRLTAVRILYPSVLDIENSFRLYSKFAFSDSKDELANILDCR